jgi:hypothetical protein
MHPEFRIQRTSTTGSGVSVNPRAWVEAGELLAVTLFGEVSCDKIAGAGHRHHTQGESCRRVFKVRACPGTLASPLPRCFVVERRELTL